MLDLVCEDSTESRVERFEMLLAYDGLSKKGCVKQPALKKNLGSGRLNENKETQMLVEMIGKSYLLEAVLALRWEWSNLTCSYQLL